MKQDVKKVTKEEMNRIKQDVFKRATKGWLQETVTLSPSIITDREELRQT